MRLKRTVTIVVVGAACAAWLAAAATSSRRDVGAPAVADPAPIDARGTALLTEIARLHDRLHPPSAQRTSTRNVFEFSSRRTPPPAAGPRTTTSEMAPVSAPAQPESGFKLEGIAEEAGPDGPVRTAIVFAAGELFLAKAGDAVTPRYRVLTVTPDVVELTDVSSNRTIRLSMR